MIEDTVRIMVDGEFHTRCLRRHGDSVIDRLGLEFDITDIHYHDDIIEITTSSNEE